MALAYVPAVSEDLAEDLPSEFGGRGVARIDHHFVDDSPNQFDVPIFEEPQLIQLVKLVDGEAKEPVVAGPGSLFLEPGLLRAGVVGRGHRLSPPGRRTMATTDD